MNVMWMNKCGFIHNSFTGYSMLLQVCIWLGLAVVYMHPILIAKTCNDHLCIFISKIAGQHLIGFW